MDECCDVTLYVYKDERYRWVFNDYAKGISREPFVAGADLMLDYLTADIQNAVVDGFHLHINEYIGSNLRPFSVLKHVNSLHHPLLGQSNYYYWVGGKRKVWLCNQIYRYFDHTPRVLWFWATPI